MTIDQDLVDSVGDRFHKLRIVHHQLRAADGVGVEEASHGGADRHQHVEVAVFTMRVDADRFEHADDLERR